MLDIKEWVSIATAVVAAYGAALSTVVFLANRREKKREVKVELSYCFPTYGSEVGSHSIMVQAANHGYRAVRLTGCGVALPNKHHVVFVDAEGHEFPCDLEGGKNCIRMVPVSVAGQEMKRVGLSGIVKVRGFYRDALGVVYKSKPFKFDVDAALR